MAITAVRNVSGSADGSAGTIAGNFAAHGAGNLAVVVVTYVDGGTISVTGVSDGTNTWHPLTEVRNATQGYSQQMWYAYNLAANAGTVTTTATFSANTTFRRIHGEEYNDSVGAFATDPFESPEGSGTGNGTAMASGSLTTAVANSVICVGGSSGSGNVSAGSGYTLRSPTGGGVSTGFADHILSSTTTETAKLTASVSGQWGLAAAKFKSVASPDATVTPSVVNATTSFPAATKSGGATVTPAAISAVATVPAVTVTAGGTTVTPSAVLASTSFPAAAPHGGATVAPASVLASTAFGAPAVTFVSPPPVATIIELAYGADPDTDLSAAVWTDITELCRYAPAVTIRAGRHGLGAQTDPLQIRVTLDNRDGQFTPFLNTGANWPNIVRNLPIRVRAASGGDTPVELATGFIDGYELGWDESTNDCVVFVTAVGRLGRLAKKKVVRAAATATVASSNAVASWPLTDGTSATSAASGLVGGASMQKTGTLKFGTGKNFNGQPPILDLGELPSTPGKLVGVIPAGTSNTSWRAEFTLTWPDLTPPTDAIGALSWTTEGTIRTWAIDYVKGSDAICLRYVLANGSGSTTYTSTLTDPYDGTPRRYRVTADQNGTGVDVRLYVNDVAKITQTIAAQTIGRPTKATGSAGYNFSGGFDGTSMPSVGGLNFWAPYAAVSVDTTGASSGYVGEMAGDRIARICDEAGVPVLVVDGVTSAMGIQKDGDLLGLLRECEAADGGILHDNGPDGSLVYIPRTARYNALVDLTVDVDLRQLQPGFRPTFDGRDSLTAAVVTQPDGSAGSYAKPGAEGDEERSFSLNLDDSESLDQHAAWRVGVGTVEGMRYPRVGLNFRRSPELVDIWLASGGIGLRLDVTNLPQQHPPLPVEQFAEGYEMRLNDHEWSADLDCVPAQPYEVVVLDTSAATLVSAVDADDTTFTTTVSRPPRWTTTDEPVALQCGGETPIVATAITDVAIAYVAAGAASHADNTSVTPAMYAGATTGDLICVLCAIRSSGTGTLAVAGYTRLAGWANFALFGKIHDGSEADPTVTPTGGSAGDTVSGFTFGLRNTVSDEANAVIDWTDWLNVSAQDINYPPLTTKRLWDGCVILYLGWKQDDFTSVATIAGATEILEASTTTGSDQSMIADYVIQTTATAIAKGSFTVTGGASAISRGMVVAIAPGRSTLTVTRATNGTAIAHSAGDAIQVADTGNLAL